MTPALVIVLLLFGPWDISGVGLAVDLVRPFFQHPSLVLVLLRRASWPCSPSGPSPSSTPCWPPGGREWRGAAPALAALGLGLILVAVAWPHAWAGEQALALHDFVTTDFTADPGQATTTTTHHHDDRPSHHDLRGGEHGPRDHHHDGSPHHDDHHRARPLGRDGAHHHRPPRRRRRPGAHRDPHRHDHRGLGRPGDGAGRHVLHPPQPGASGPSPRGSPPTTPGRTTRYPEITNTIYAYGLDHPDLFPGGPNTGGNAVKAILGEGLGLRIDYFAVVDLLGFVDLVDAIGGIDIYVTKPVNDPQQWWPNGETHDVVIGVGQHHFDGL